MLSWLIGWGSFILYALSHLLNQFQSEDWWFAAQCIPWLAITIQFTQIIAFDQYNNIFLAEYVRDCVVTSLLQYVSDKILIPESDILILDTNNDSNHPELNLNIDSDNEVHSSQSKLLPTPRFDKWTHSNVLRSGVVFNDYREPTDLRSQAKFAKFNT